MKSNIKFVVPFLWVKRMNKSIQFYVDGLNFKIKDKWLVKDKIQWCLIESGGAALMLQEFWKSGPHRNIQKGKLGTGVSIGFICKDALVFYKDVVSQGIIAAEPFVGNSMWVTELTDPDGYKLFFESKTDVPEETKYTEWIQTKSLNT